jgi:glycosyltransferase involved in cell wall biosynthesis
LKVAHVITGVRVGGAETMLWKLISNSSPGIQHHVISLTGDGPIGVKLRSIGVPVDLRQITMGPLLPLRILELSRSLKAIRPDVVQTWMYHSDLFGGLAARLAGLNRIAWNVRASRLDAKLVGRRTMMIVRACARTSGYIPKKIVCCSEASLRVHAELGYDTAKMTVIQNGFDLSSFKPDSAARSAIRNELGIDHDAVLVGLVARFDPLKGHRTFLEAARRVRQRHPGVQFLLCGADITMENSQLMAWVDAAGARDAVHVLGYRADVARIYSSLDIATCVSTTEGFPNVVGEAMAAGVPCVVTDVGDSALIVGSTGEVVAPEDAEGLADALSRLITMGSQERSELGARARLRVQQEFELGHVVRRYESFYQDLLS